MRFFFSPIKCLKLRRIHFRNLNSVAERKIKLSYSFKSGTVPLLNSTLGDLLDHAADVEGDSTAYISMHQNVSKTYLQLKNEAERLASGLLACGLEKGDRIAIYSPNCYEWPLTQFAAAKAGLILVNINFSSEPQEVEYFLKKVGCKALIAYDKLKRHDYYEVLNKIFPDLPTRNPINIQDKNLPHMKTIIMISEDNKAGTVRFKDVENYANKDSDVMLSKIEKSIQFDDSVNIQYTSGTTGKPKAAVLTHHSIINNAALNFRRIGYDTINKPIICCQVPLFHCNGCVIVVIGSVLCRSTCVFPSAGFDSVASLKSIEKYKCTSLFGTPTMHGDVLKSHKQLQTDISSIKEAITGGSPALVPLIEALYKELGLPQVLIGYGLTETSPVLTIMEKNTRREEVLHGYLEPLEYVELKVIDSEGCVVPINTRGELCCKGHPVFMGYWDDEKKTRDSIDEKKWFHTGDLVIMDERGWIKVVGRIKDIVIRGGENIFVLEVENFISSHPAVQEVNIVGVPDERLGEELCCWINIKPGMSLTEEEIRNFCKGKISYYKIPRYIMFVEEFPKTTSGKIKKTEIVKISRTKLNL